ncbi:MAG: hypothetical protein IT379_42395 [Deltaproteobacteria bacterium]|nr:hypothetical protein [Deltaproteobacteria bacterium]
MRSVLIASCLCISLGACMAPVGTGGVVSVPSDAATQCESHCASIGLRLGAVAIMANNVGCVCQVAHRGGEAAITAGMATIAMQQEAAAQQQAQQAAQYRRTRSITSQGR